MKKIDENKMVKGVFEGKLIGVRKMGRARKRWIDSLGEILRSRAVNVGQTEQIKYDRCA